MKVLLSFPALLFIFILPLFPQSSGESGAGILPLKKLSLYSSGVGFFEHQGTPAAREGGAAFTLPFKLSVVDDALKSLSILIPSAASSGGTIPVSVSYTGWPSENGFSFLGTELGINPGIVEMLRELRGEEVEIKTPASIRGRILAVEYRASGGVQSVVEVFLSLLCENSIRTINLKDISEIVFASVRINGAFAQSLDRFMEERNDGARELRVNITGAAGPVLASYVIPTAVWKVSYRLDLSGTPPRIQGWAIVDNDSDTDWEQVELSLVSGRPVSFIQHLYVPYHVYRPVVPLAIAGTAQSRTYDGALAYSADGEQPRAAQTQAAPMPRTANGAVQMQKAMEEESVVVRPSGAAGLEGQSWAASGLASAQGADIGDQFQFTLNRPVTIRRRESAMLPLIESPVEARKVLVFQGGFAPTSGTVHPAIGAELVNKTGMRLPAGPITIYDGGAYAGDALIGFFPEQEKRLISYGDDLTVQGAVSITNSRIVSAVTVAQGVMTISRRQIFETVYTLRNSAVEAKSLIIEHRVTAGTTLAEPAAASERTAEVYRFESTLPPVSRASGTFTFTVKEERPVSEQITLARLNIDSFLSYAANGEIPATVRASLERAVELKRQADAAQSALSELETRRGRLVSEQDRIRRNLEAAGNQSPQGQEYLRRLQEQDKELDALAVQIAAADGRVKSAVTAWDDYLKAIHF
jgi:hypothetical protein